MMLMPKRWCFSRKVLSESIKPERIQTNRLHCCRGLSRALKHAACLRLSLCSVVINQNGRNKLWLLSIMSSRDVIPAPAQHFLPPDERESKGKRIFPRLHSCDVVCNIVAACDDIATIKKSSQFAVTVFVCRFRVLCSIIAASGRNCTQSLCLHSTHIIEVISFQRVCPPGGGTGNRDTVDKFSRNFN